MIYAVGSHSSFYIPVEVNQMRENNDSVEYWKKNFLSKSIRFYHRFFLLDISSGFFLKLEY